MGPKFAWRPRPSENGWTTKFSVSPVRLESALRAELGLAPWRAEFDRIRPDPAKTAAAVLGSTAGPTAPRDGAPDENRPRHAVVVHIALPSPDFGSQGERSAVHDLKRRIDAIVRAADAGVVDGDEFGAGEAVLYIHGSDAERLFATMETELRAFPMRPIRAILVFGDDIDHPAAERHVDLPA
jgi:hypothetical protein